MGPRVEMKLGGAGRLAIGLGMVVAPVVTGRPWIGEAADGAGGRIALRALGAREVLLGAMAVHVAGAADPRVAARWASAVALCDGVATVAAGRSLPPRAQGVTALALGSAIAGFAIGARLRADAD